MKLLIDTAMESKPVGEQHQQQQQGSLNGNNKRARKKTNEKTATFLTQEFLNASQNAPKSSSTLSLTASSESSPTVSKKAATTNTNTNNNSNSKSTKVSKSKSKQQSKSSSSSSQQTSLSMAKKAQEEVARKEDTTTTMETVEDLTTTSQVTTSNAAVMSDLNKIRKNKDIKARYWSYLLASLKRAIDEIYFTCESDESISSCKESISILENCTDDFRSLIARIQLMNDYEKSNKRPNSIAWEVRKMNAAMRRRNNNINNNNNFEDQNNNGNDFGEEESTGESGIGGSGRGGALGEMGFASGTTGTGDDEHEESSSIETTGFKDFTPSYFVKKRPSEHVVPFGNNHVDEETMANRFASYHDRYTDEDDEDFDDLDYDEYLTNTKLKLLDVTKQPLALDDSPGKEQSTNEPFLIHQQPPYGSSASWLMQAYQSATALTGNVDTGNQQQQQHASNSLQRTLTADTNNFYNFSNLMSPFASFSFSNFDSNNKQFATPAPPPPPGTTPSTMANAFANLPADFSLAASYDNQLFVANSLLQNDDLMIPIDWNFPDAATTATATGGSGRSKSENHLDRHHNTMIKLYEEEEKNIEFEIKQDEKLLIVLEEEAQLTRQLSVEHFAHLNQLDIAKNKKNGSFLLRQSSDFEDSKSNMLSSSSNRTSGARESRYNGAKDFLNDDLDIESAQGFSGRVPQMHGKPQYFSRKESPNQRRRKHEEKQARAQEKREQFYQDRLDRLRELTKKIETVNELKKRLLRAKKATMKAKLQRAEEKRLYLLRLKSTKASVEEQKAHEIAFINSLAAQNRKQDILEKYEKRNETIKHNLEEERLRKQEEQKAKEQAAESRRRELESQRKARLSEMLEKRRLKESKIEQNQLEKEKERIESARAKEKTREIRLATMEAQFQASKQQARRKIIQKQEEWCKRHELNLEEIRKKAFEMSILRFSSDDQSGTDVPTPTPYDKAKFCKVCQVVIRSELQLKSHLRGPKHQQFMNEEYQGKQPLTKTEIEDFNLRCMVDGPKETTKESELIERLNAMKKRLKKIKTKVLESGFEYEASKKSAQESQQSEAVAPPSLPQPSLKSKIPKLLKELEKISKSNDRYNPNVDRTCGELNRILLKNSAEQSVFFHNNGLTICTRLLEQINNITLNGNTSQVVSAVSNEIIANSTKTTNNLVCVIVNSIQANADACVELTLSNKLLSLVEILNLHSKIMLSSVVGTVHETSAASSHCSSSRQSSNTNSNMGYGGTNGNNNSSQQRISNEWLICSNLFNLFGSIYSFVCERNGQKTNHGTKEKDLNQRAHDFISLITNYGLIDAVSVFFNNITGPLDENQPTAEVLRNCLKFLVSVTKYLIQRKPIDIFCERKSDDSTQLISTLRATNLINIVPMLYGILHKDASTPIKSIYFNCSTNIGNSHAKSSSSSSSLLSKDVIDLELTTLGVRLLNQIITLDLSRVQSLLGEESLSLQIRHIASYLIWHTNVNKNDELLHEVILFIGYFTVLNNQNQLSIELGTPPTILQQLCNLPFNYFSDKKLISILYPTLICFCFKNEKNKVVLCNELNGNTLATFIAERIKIYDEKNTNDNEDLFEFRHRFPYKLWEEAQDYFKS